MYGESVFTTMRMLDGVLVDWDYHFDRLRKGVEFLYGPFTDADEWMAILKNMLEARMQSENGDRVIRLTVYREGDRGLICGGLISVTDLKINVISSHYDTTHSHDKTFKLRSCTGIMKPQWWPSFLKAGNYLGTILAQKVCMQPHDDDILFLAPDETILESSVSNIFVVRNKKLFTPPVGPNVLDGVMRKKVLEVAHDLFDDVIIEASRLPQLYKADAVFGTNSVRGLFLVDHIDDNELTYSQEMLHKLETLKARVFR